MTIKSKIQNLALCGALALSFTAGMAAINTAAAKDIRGWNIHVEDYPVSIAMESFLADVTTKTDGRIKGKIFHGGVLGSQPDAIEQIRL
jgi:TRAP-type C4-dicarboxylate transport system substrate-binding protein